MSRTIENSRRTLLVIVAAVAVAGTALSARAQDAVATATQTGATADTLPDEKQDATGSWSPVIDGLQTRLRLLTKQPRLGHPLYVRLELRNVSDKRRHINADPLSVSDFLTVVQNNGEPVKSRPPVYEPGAQRTVEPGDTIVLWDRRNIAPAIRLQKPGTFSVATRSIDSREKSVFRDGKRVSTQLSSVPASRKLAIDLRDGSLPEDVEIQRRLKQVLPETWTLKTARISGLFSLIAPRGLFEAAEQAQQASDPAAWQGMQSELAQSLSTIRNYDEGDIDPATISLPDGEYFERLGRSEAGEIYAHIKPRLIAEWPQCRDVLRSVYFNTGRDSPRPSQVSHTGSITCLHDGNAAAVVLITDSKKRRSQRTDSDSPADNIRWEGDRPVAVTIAADQFELCDGRVFETDQDGRIIQLPLHRPPVITPDNAVVFLDQVAGIKARLFFRHLRDDVDEISHGHFAPGTPKAQAFDRVMRQFDRAFPTNPSVRANVPLSEFFQSDRIRSPMVRSLQPLMGTGSRGSDQYDHAIRIIRELGRPNDLKEIGILFYEHSDRSPLNVLARDESQLKLRLRPESRAFQFLDAARTVARRSSKPVQFANMLGQLDFLHRLTTEPGYRPAGWEQRFAQCLPDGYQRPSLLSLYALENAPLPLPVPEEIGPSSSFDHLIPRICYVVRGHLSPSPDEQIAALNLAARTKSCWFLPHIRNALTSKNANVRAAAKVAEQACVKPRWSQPLPAEARRLAELDVTKVDAILSRLEKSDAQAVAMEDARELSQLTRLDYGQDKAAWLDWWKEEKYSRRIAFEGRRPIVITGTVTDHLGQALPEATVTLSLHRNYVYGAAMTARVTSDRRGRFLLRSGYPKDVSKVTNEASIGVLPGFVFVEKPGYEIATMSHPQKLQYSEFDVSEDSILRIAREDLQRTDEPLTLNASLRPAVQVAVKIEDPLGKSVSPITVSATWTEATGGQISPASRCSCCGEYSAWPAFSEKHQAAVGVRVCDLRKQSDDEFSFRQFRPAVARAFTVLVAKPGPNAANRVEPEETTQLIDFPQPGQYVVRLKYDSTAQPGSRINVIDVTSAGDATGN